MKQFIIASKQLFGLSENQTLYNYEDIISIVRNKLIEDNFKFDTNGKILNEDEPGVVNLSRIAAYEFALMCVNPSKNVIKLSDSNYMGFGVKSLKTVISSMTLTSLQVSCEEALKSISTKYPINETDSTYLMLVMLLTYDLGMYNLSAIIASILWLGIVDDATMG